MKAVMIMFDTLCRNFLPSYGGSAIMPNFERLADNAVTFDNFYIGSMPCIPARRELHTGRYNFLHRSWGPIEPFDDSMPEMLKKSGIHTHLITDHLHYWEDGGATYHNRYSTYEFIRGQQDDLWSADIRLLRNVKCPHEHADAGWKRAYRQCEANRTLFEEQGGFPGERSVMAAVDFLKTNGTDDDWFLQLECFDPHEPYDVPQKYIDMYSSDDVLKQMSWLPYHSTGEGHYTEGEYNDSLIQYFATLSMCDDLVGKILDEFDRQNLWQDTMLIVNTDHGFLLGEKGWWSKSNAPTYNEVANTPFFIWDPASNRKGERCATISQTIDIPATLLKHFKIAPTKDMQGVALQEALQNDDAILHESILFGYFGCQVNITDGRYLYMRGQANQQNTPLNEYTLIPTHMTTFFTPQELGGATLSEPFSFTKGLKTLKIPCDNPVLNRYMQGTKLFDLQKDPQQLMPIEDAKVERYMLLELVRQMELNDAPPEQYERLGINRADIERSLSSHLDKNRDSYIRDTVDMLKNIKFESGHLRNQTLYLCCIVGEKGREELVRLLIDFHKSINPPLTQQDMFDFVQSVRPADSGRIVRWLYSLARNA